MRLNEIVDKAIFLYQQGKYTESLNIYKSVISKNFSREISSTLYYNMGLCNYSMGKFKASENNFRKSIDLGGECGYDLFLSIINQGDIPSSKKWWIHRSTGKRKSFPDLPLKRLKFEEIRGKNLLVLNEQGFGDEFMFSRVIQTLSKECKSVSYQVYDETLPVFKEYFKFDNVTYFTNRNLSREFVTDHEGFCLSGDFFFDLMDNDYEIRYSGGDRKKWDVGLCWSTNIKSSNSDLRSIDPDLITSELSGKNIVSLQKDLTHDGLDSTRIESFMDTFELILKCQEIWTVDTSVAHLAILLGSKVSILYKDYLDWRWKVPIYKNYHLKRIDKSPK